MKKKSIIIIGAVLLALAFSLSGCDFFSGATSNLPSMTQAMGDQDFTLGSNSITVAGQLGNYVGEGESVSVYIITTSTCTTPPLYIKQSSMAPLVIYTIYVTCSDGTWKVTGKVDPNGQIKSATATKQ